MNKISRFAFPALMLAGIAVSLAVLLLSLNPAANASNQRSSQAMSGDAELAALGRHLFVAKGCIVCHRQNAARAEALAALGNDPQRNEYLSNIGDDVPDLNTVQADAAFLRRWLKDPSAVKPGTTMPTLNLSGDEIEALIAFLKSKA